MKYNFSKSIPLYVQITILAEVKRMMILPAFANDDKFDLIQDFLLFYLENFQDTTRKESYVVTSIRNQARDMIKARMNQDPGIFFTLDDLDTYENNISGYEVVNFKMMLQAVSHNLSEDEKDTISRLGEGYTLDEVSKNKHISKNTIYKIFKKMQKNIKK